MSNFSTNVFDFLSIESFLEKSLYDTQGANFLHNDYIQCYAKLAEGMGWEQVFSNLAKAADTTVSNQDIINTARKYLNQIRKNKANNSLPN